MSAKTARQMVNGQENGHSMPKVSTKSESEGDAEDQVLKA